MTDAPAAASTTIDLADLLDSIEPVDATAARAAELHHRKLTKPEGSLGALEHLGSRLAAIARTAVPPLPEPAVCVVFAGDHGVHAERVTPWPQAVTAQMVANICDGGAAINAIADTNGIDVVVVNVGVANPVGDHPRLRNHPIGRGTANLATGPALTTADAHRAILVGAGQAADLVGQGARCLLTGEMGIANTTPSAAVIAALTGSAPAAVTGRGTGIDDETLARKTEVVASALDRARPDSDDPVSVVAELGGFELAAVAGLCLGGAAARVPVVVDGVITLAGALIAHRLRPAVGGYLVAGHRSVEPAASVALDHLDLEPLLDLGLRLGEGTGAALAYPLVRAAARVMSDMATFDQAAIGDAAATTSPEPGAS